MSIFTRLNELLQMLAARGRSTIDAIIDAVRTAWSGDPETRRRVAFSVAIIALSAKMAKADGVVTMDEVDAFRDILDIPAEETRNVFRLYDIAKQDTAGYEIYAQRLKDFCSNGDGDCPLLTDVLDALFHIAKADGLIHERELVFLQDIATIFGLSEQAFARMQHRHLEGPNDPYAVLGINPDSTPREARRRYLTLVRENHPDQLQARGVPEEFLFIATERMKAINTAYEQIAGKTAA
ncbi:molecular chaperone DjiA [Fulvimarina endophytica]|uniref:Molecular chaperone DjiA n=1 Tax=Fulvimarina endophytica TaxID=2293836 RepID=A0A371X0R7_9HYPH|nr:DnaJ family molecular chaperone [Fulvimarina endophytica]RFC62795.1 molecular chaperone DjiA [Fulvimarina endophytica]